jgi:hypothetical protein
MTSNIFSTSLNSINSIPAGEMFVISSGRQVGKSMVIDMLKTRQRILGGNLCKEIIMPQEWTIDGARWYRPKNKNKYKFSRQWFTVDLAPGPYSDDIARLEWCRETFGPEPLRPDAWSRWTYSFATHCQIKFRDAQDYEWYRLRWGA